MAKKKMDARTLKALKGSIKKWEKIVAGTGVDLGYKNCDLCKMDPSFGCDNCPVGQYGRLDRWQCRHTPWPDWARHHEDKHGADPFGPINYRVLCPTCKRLAEKELAFLKKLLPKGSD